MNHVEKKPRSEDLGKLTNFEVDDSKKWNEKRRLT